MKINKCYAVINNDTGEYLRCSYKYPIPFYTEYKQAQNALRGYKARYITNANGYKIVEIDIDRANKTILEEIVNEK